MTPLPPNPDTSVIVVAGAPRCGSSLLMRMLYLGGVDVVADMGRQSFEDSRVQPGTLPSAFLDTCRGRALKVLDPHRNQLPRGFAYRLIWISRDVRQQAQAAIKFARWVGCGIPDDARTRAAFARSIAHDRELFRRRDQPHLHLTRLDLTFEGILADPVGTSLALAAWLDRPLDIAAMAAAVMARSPLCSPLMWEAVMEAAPSRGPAPAGLLAGKGIGA